MTTRESGREQLGPADVDDETLAGMVADLLGEDEVEVTDLRVTPVDYELPAITTAARHWVSGHAATSRGPRPFRMFVKQVQCWSRSPYFAFVPAQAREMAAADVPWRTEPLLYRSDVSTVLPAGLSMPRALGVFDLDERSASIWLEAVPARSWPWSAERYRRAAFLLGRLAASPQVAPFAEVGEHRWTVRQYLTGRFHHQVAPMLAGEVWSHPLVARAFTPHLRDRMRAAAEEIAALVDELATGPHGTAHGDACPNNLLGAEREDELVMIDFGFWKPLPLGFDLGQLLLGEVQLGRRSGATLGRFDAALVSAYVEGLAAEGLTVDARLIERQHALQMLVFSGLSSVPFEHLDQPSSARVDGIAVARAEIATYCLDLVERTRAG